MSDRPPAVSPTVPPPSELLCSVVLIAEVDFAALPAMMAAATAFLEPRFRFWEIVVVAPQQARLRHGELFDRIAAADGVRLILTRPHVDRYQLFPLAAAQSIGDVVLFATDEEFAAIDMPAIWAAAEAGASVRLTGRRVGWLDRWTTRLLSSLVGFSTEPETLRSGLHYRERLSWLLERSDSELAFRFPAMWAAGREDLRTLRVEGARLGRTPKRTLVQRALVAADLVAHAAPRLLKLVAVASLAGLLGGLAFTVYAIAIWLLKDDLAAGWFSTSLAIAGSTSFICAALGSIALGVARLLEIQLSHATDDIITQSGGGDALGRLEALNIVSPRS